MTQALYFYISPSMYPLFSPYKHSRSRLCWNISPSSCNPQFLSYSRLSAHKINLSFNFTLLWNRLRSFDTPHSFVQPTIGQPVIQHSGKKLSYIAETLKYTHGISKRHTTSLYEEQRVEIFLVISRHDTFRTQEIFNKFNEEINRWNRSNPIQRIRKSRPGTPSSPTKEHTSICCYRFSMYRDNGTRN